VQDILEAMAGEQHAIGQAPPPDAEDKAQRLVQSLGDGDFRSELASFPDVVKGRRVYTFVEQRRTQVLTRKVSSR
jgi:hypothetical protein